MTWVPPIAQSASLPPPWMGPVTAPKPAANFAGSNLLGATLTDQAAPPNLRVTVPSNRAGANNSRATWTEAPGGAGTIYELGFVPFFSTAFTTGIPIFSLMIGDSAGKLIEFGVYQVAGGVHVQCTKLASVTAGAGAAYRDDGAAVSLHGGLFLQLVDGGAGGNLTWNYSVDGLVWTLFTQKARNDFLGVIDKVGIDADFVVATANLQVSADIFHMKGFT